LIWKQRPIINFQLDFKSKYFHGIKMNICLFETLIHKFFVLLTDDLLFYLDDTLE